jgi:hypothetical protein
MILGSIDKNLKKMMEKNMINSTTKWSPSERSNTHRNKDKLHARHHHNATPQHKASAQEP